MNRYFRKFTRFFSWVVIALVAVLFVRSLQANWHSIKDLDLSPDIHVVLALICFVLSIVASGIAWGHIVEKLTKIGVPTREVIRIHLASWLLKYIPGQAGSLLNKLSWAKKRHIDGKMITASFIYENTFLLLASAITSIPILLIALSEKFSEDTSLFLPLLAALPVVVLVMTPRAFAILLNFLFRVLKKQPLTSTELLSNKDNARFLAEFTIPRLINGAAFVFLAISLLGIPSSLYLTFGAIYILAGIIGLLAIFVPSGLGVREAVITLFASAYIPVEQAVALALLARFYATIADIIVALIYVGLGSKKEETS